MGYAFWYLVGKQFCNDLLLIYALKGRSGLAHHLASCPALSLNLVVCISVLLQIVRQPEIETRIAEQSSLV